MLNLAKKKGVRKMLHMIKMPHHKDDYECMWNGIEDLYIQKTGEKIPPNFFFSLASFGSFCYMKTEKSDVKRLVALGDGRTKQMFEFLAPIVGFEYKFHVCKTVEKAIKKAKIEIDNGYPVILGALDMFYLPYYEKIYYTEHIPFHYVLMIGYDDKKENITILDCGREEPQELPYNELKAAWNCNCSGVSKPFTLCTIRMKNVKSKKQIAKEALQKKANMFLYPSAGFIGYKGFEKFIMELPKWKRQLGRENYNKQLFNMVQFYGTVPAIPNALRGINEPDKIVFGGGFDKISCVLSELGEEYKNDCYKAAAKIFNGGVVVIEEIKKIIVEYLTGTNDETNKLPSLYTKLKNIMIEGFSKLEY